MVQHCRHIYNEIVTMVREERTSEKKEEDVYELGYTGTI